MNPIGENRFHPLGTLMPRCLLLDWPLQPMAETEPDGFSPGMILEISWPMPCTKLALQINPPLPEGMMAYPSKKPISPH